MLRSHEESVSGKKGDPEPLEVGSGVCGFLTLGFRNAVDVGDIDKWKQ